MAGKLGVRRWTKGGHDRVYVSAPGGAEIGWRDLRTGREQLRLPGMWPQFNARIEEWKHEQPRFGGPSRPDPRTRGERGQAGRGAGAGPAARAAELQPRNPVLRAAARLAGARTADRSWRAGAKGEVKVGRSLDRLARHGWRVLHSIELGGGTDIDHLLIGPAGIFTVNTKHHHRARVSVGHTAVFVRGNPHPYPARAVREAARARAALIAASGRPVNVEALVVIYGHARLSGWVRRQPAGAKVLPARAVTWWLRLPGRHGLSPGDIEDLYQAAGDPATWAHGKYE